MSILDGSLRRRVRKLELGAGEGDTVLAITSALDTPEERAATLAWIEEQRSAGRAVLVFNDPNLVVPAVGPPTSRRGRAP